MDDTTVANMALSAIGTRSSITSLAEQSPEANVALLHYASTRDALLRRFTWDWARRQNPLTVWKAAAGTPENPAGASPQPPIPWRYSYAWPADCLKFQFILPVDNLSGVAGVPLTTGGVSAVPIVQLRRQPIKALVAGDLNAGNPIKVVLTDQYQAIAVYTGAVNDPNVWDSLFVEAMVGRLAAKFVIPLSGDKGLAKLAIEAGKSAEAEAEAANAQEDIYLPDPQTDWIEARSGDVEDL